MIRPHSHDFPVVAIGASAGGIAALKLILSELPADFPAAVAIVQHRNQTNPGMLEHLLGARSALVVVPAREGAWLEPGTVHVAPGGYHLVVDRSGMLSLSDSKKVNFSRPAADRLFESAACLGSRVIALVLTGYDSDGSSGAMAVKQRGGLVLTQSPETCQAPDMPRATIATGDVDLVVPLNRIASELVRLVGLPIFSST